jgi:hypothetical protein
MTSFLLARSVAVGAGLLAAGLHAAAVDGPQPGLWKVVTRPEMNGMQAPAEVKTRCLKPEHVQDLERTFAPEYRVQGSSCGRMDVQWSGQKLAWRVQCTGPLSMDVAGTYEFDSPQHYSGVVTLLGSMAGREMRSRTVLEGERIGECPTENGGQRTDDGK